MLPVVQLDELITIDERVRPLDLRRVTFVILILLDGVLSPSTASKAYMYYYTLTVRPIRR